MVLESQSHRVLLYILYIKHGLTLCTLFSESEWLYRDGPLIKSVSFVETVKNVIHSKLMSNPFKGVVP